MTMNKVKVNNTVIEYYGDIDEEFIKRHLFFARQEVLEELGMKVYNDTVHS